MIPPPIEFVYPVGPVYSQAFSQWDAVYSDPIAFFKLSGMGCWTPVIVNDCVDMPSLGKMLKDV